MPMDVDRQIPVTHVQNGVAVGGSLLVCSDRLVFAPNMLEGALKVIKISKAKAVEIPFSEIESVGKHEGELKLKELLSGGIWDRMALNLKNGGQELFVVSINTDEAIEYIGGRIKGG